MFQKNEYLYTEECYEVDEKIYMTAGELQNAIQIRHDLLNLEDKMVKLTAALESLLNRYNLRAEVNKMPDSEIAAKANELLKTIPEHIQKMAEDEPSTLSYTTKWFLELSELILGYYSLGSFDMANAGEDVIIIDKVKKIMAKVIMHDLISDDDDM